MRRFIVVLAGLALTGCASLHSVAITEQDFSTPAKRQPFDLKVSATGVDLGEAAGIARSLSKSQAVRRASNTVEDVWAAITYGPRTGQVTFTDAYADSLAEAVGRQCGGRPVSGLMVVRETNKYPVVSGEIVRIQGNCL